MKYLLVISIHEVARLEIMFDTPLLNRDFVPRRFNPLKSTFSLTLTSLPVLFLIRFLHCILFLNCSSDSSMKIPLTGYHRLTDM